MTDGGCLLGTMPLAGMIQFPRKRSQNFLQQIEAGRKKEIWLSTVERLAKAFSLEVHEFLAPECPVNSKPVRKKVSSRVHKGKTA